MPSERIVQDISKLRKALKSIVDAEGVAVRFDGRRHGIDRDNTGPGAGSKGVKKSTKMADIKLHPHVASVVKEHKLMKTHGIGPQDWQRHCLAAFDMSAEELELSDDDEDARTDVL